MNLFLRFMIVLLAALRSGTPRPALEPTRIDFKVWFNDHLFCSAVPNHRVRSYTDLATINSVIRIGLGLLIRRNGWMPIIQAETICLSGPLHFPQKLSIVTTIVGWQDNYVCYAHDLYAGGHKVAESRMLARIIGRKGAKVPIDSIARELGAPDVSPEIGTVFLAMIAESEMGRTSNPQAIPA